MSDESTKESVDDDSASPDQPPAPQVEESDPAQDAAPVREPVKAARLRIRPRAVMLLVAYWLTRPAREILAEHRPH